MADSFRVDFDASTVNAALDKLGDGVNALVRPAAQAGAQVFYDEARSRVPVSKKGHWFHGTSFKINGTKYWFDSGSLKASIYQVYSKDNSTEDRATYQIAWNHRKVPYGFMVEYGTSRAGAHSFIRTAFDANQQALQAADAKFSEGARQLIASLT